MKIGKVVFALVASSLLSAVVVWAEDASEFVWQSDSAPRYPDLSVRPTSALVGWARDDSPSKSAAVDGEQPDNQRHEPAPRAVQPRIVHPKASDPNPLGTANPFHEEPPARRPGVADGAALGPLCNSCGDGSCPGSCRASADDPYEEESWRLFSGPRLDAARARLRGWIDQGVTWNPDRPGTGFNGPVTFNDRANEYQMNQLYLIGERTTNTDGFGFDWGGRVDVLYGTDSRFLAANGLESSWNKSQRFYGAALPQFYADFALDDLIVRIGHFYNIMDYESPMAPENFFYSHSYSFQYGEPLTFTGILGMFRLNDCWTFTGGVHRGWNQFEDNNDKAGLLFGVTWTSPDRDTLVNFAITLSNEQIDRPSHMTAYTVAVSHRFSERVRYVFEHNAGQETNAIPRGNGAFDDAQWYSIANYLFYDLNPCWSVGLRYEWFGDIDGTRVIGLGAPKGFPWAGIPSHWDELALGVNYQRSSNVLLRSELRFDWADRIGPSQFKPFDTFNRDQQFLWATDLVVKF